MASTYSLLLSVTPETSHDTYDNVKSVLVIFFKLLPLSLRILPVQLDVDIGCIKLLGNVHLHALVGGNDNLRSTIEFQELGKDKTGWSSTEEENLNADRRVKLVESVNSTRGRLEEG